KGAGRHRWVGEIVFPQMAKADRLALWGGREDVADLDLAVGDDHAIDEQEQQLPPLLERRGREPLLDAPAEVRERGRHARQFAVAFRLAIELTLLLGQALLLLLQRAATALVFVQRDDPAQVGVREAVELLPQAGTPLPEVLAPGL